MTKKISQLPAATSVDTNDEFVINQDGTTKKLTTANQWDFANVNIDGGTIDGTAIGSSTASSGAFTTATVNAGTDSAPSITTAGDTNTGIYFPSTNEIAFTEGGQEAMRINSSGHAIIPAGVTLGTSAGVYNADNTLDDYEEGTWTPVLSATGLSATYSTQQGTYTKIGRFVFITCDIQLSGGTLGSANFVRVAGHPFNFTGAGGDLITSDIVYNNFNTLNNRLYGQFVNVGFYLYEIDEEGQVTSAGLNATKLTTSSRISFQAGFVI